jgi:hypothetical protein
MAARLRVRGSHIDREDANKADVEWQILAWVEPKSCTLQKHDDRHHG